LMNAGRWQPGTTRNKKNSKMRLAVTVFFLVASVVTFGQADTVALKDAMSRLDNALVNKDEKALTLLLSNDVTYGHSNGWIQSKSDIINDLKSGKLDYSKIDNTSLSIAAINSNWATVRTNTNAEGKANGNLFQLKLHILEVWLKTKSGWQLIARQSTKL